MVMGSELPLACRLDKSAPVFDLRGFVAVNRETRESVASNTGSAKTAIVFGNGLRPALSWRNAAIIDADGRLTISRSTIKGL